MSLTGSTTSGAVDVAKVSASGAFGEGSSTGVGSLTGEGSSTGVGSLTVNTGGRGAVSA